MTLWCLGEPRAESGGRALALAPEKCGVAGKAAYTRAQPLRLFAELCLQAAGLCLSQPSPRTAAEVSGCPTQVPPGRQEQAEQGKEGNHPPGAGRQKWTWAPGNPKFGSQSEKGLFEIIDGVLFCMI